MENPVLNQNQFPAFSSILPESIEPALKHIISQNRNELNELLKNSENFTWDKLMLPLEEMTDRISKMWSPVSHMHAVVENDALRAVYNTCLPVLTEYHTELMQNEILYKAIKSIAEGKEYTQLNVAQRKVIDDELRDFRLAGVSLELSAKAQFGELQKQLSKLTTKFAENLLDATQAWSLHVTDLDALKGLSEEALSMAKETANQRGEEGWIFTLEYPVYVTVMKYLENRELRWLMYEAYVTRASDQGPFSGKWDNTPLMDEILRKRHELANLLGFKNFAEYSLATKMADTPKRVLGFLNDLVKKSKKAGEQDMKELEEFAKELDGLDQLEAWDLAYYTEKLRQKKIFSFTRRLKTLFSCAASDKWYVCSCEEALWVRHC